MTRDTVGVPTGPEESERLLDVVELYADDLDGSAYSARASDLVSDLPRPRRPRGWLGVVAVLGLLLAAFVFGRASVTRVPAVTAKLAAPTSAVSVTSASESNLICDRPAYELTVVAGVGTEDAVAAVATYFPGFVLQSAHRFVYADTLKLCRVELTASDRAGVALRLQAHTGPGNPYDVMANRILTGQHVIVLSHMSDNGFVVSIEIAGPAAASLPSVSDLERFVADPVLAA
ncbi:hypothetical protein SAMN05892883_1107 [Jatrophihabitans sp. GAS493]|uniref:hypothetical protein n=1 Tax=Jatrophihabitans sp. GAS493 TaxID=1907575 RepID=UPI000BBF7E5F|nr:hypothetical protein [Jatrophihabitans sp. GAS493]SOD71612.1 hypothetical protein SAMN05892883_1107 [Jatrophihabitans sp. GAS493]